MKTVPSLKSGGYTLVEMLVVLCIISVLTSLTMSGITSALAQARATEAKSSVVALRTAICQYEADYNRLPISGSGTETVQDTALGNAVLAVLLGDSPHRLNPRRTRYLDFKAANGGANGFVGDGSGYGFMDPWGEPFQFMMDANQDDWISNPDRLNSDARILQDAMPQLATHVVVFSKGPDRKAHTRDDIVSWR
jgi:prepilin-type N-terminal cleavage/methylation domain-containing protein